MKYLTRRERQLLDIVYQIGEGTAEEIRSRLPNAPGNATVRRLLRILEEKGHLAHRQDGQRYVYRPTVNRERASRSALQHVLKTYFGGSPTKAVAALLSMSREELDPDELDALVRLIATHEQDGEKDA